MVASRPASQPETTRTSVKAHASQTTLRMLPLQQSNPPLRLLSHLQVVSSVLATALVSLSLASYGASVYVDRQINQATRQFDQLQRSEQQLTTVNEVLKNYMAHQAEQGGMGLSPPQPNNVIFLRPTEPEIAQAPSSAPDPSQGQQPDRQTPLGY
jgi:hypothetical protein